MLIIHGPADVQELLDLALEVQEVESCGWKEAVRRSVELKPRLACDIENDLRYEPVIEVHTCWTLPPRDVPAAAPAPVARLAVRTRANDELEYSYFTTHADAHNEHRKLRRQYVMSTIQYWQAAEQRWVG
jgi:hypothetical protein